MSGALARLMSTAKYPISALPLPPKSHVLTCNLTPDPLTPSAEDFRNVLVKNPSVQRRARLAHPSAHFSRLTPLPLPFPYQITPPENEEVEDKAEFVERWLSSYEPLEERPSAAPSQDQGTLKKYSSEKRELRRELIGLSDTGLRDCLPHLDVGNAFTQLGKPALAKLVDETNGTEVNGNGDNASRKELVDVLSGQDVMLSNGEDGSIPYTPWSLRYSGHQFGVWAGQLGDGRAISICEFF